MARLKAITPFGHFKTPVSQRVTCREGWCDLPPLQGKFRCERHERRAQQRLQKSSKVAFKQFASAIGLTSLYAIRCRDAIKIGIAYDVADRLAGMQTGTPERLQLLAFSPSLKATEKELHKQLKAHRIHGEWFRECDEVLAVVEQIKAKAFMPREYVALHIANIKAGGKIPKAIDD